MSKNNVVTHLRALLDEEEDMAYLMEIEYKEVWCHWFAACMFRWDQLEEVVESWFKEE